MGYILRSAEKIERLEGAKINEIVNIYKRCADDIVVLADSEKTLTDTNKRGMAKWD